MTEATPNCPVCDSPMSRINLPKHKVHVCGTCSELAQTLTDGTVLPMSMVLDRIALRDDRILAAISTPRISTVRSFLDTFENATQAWRSDIGTAIVSLRSVLAQIENRLDFALHGLSGVDLAIPELTEILESIRDARDLASTLPAGKRGIIQEGSDDIASYTIQTATPAD
jgi:hypothetical protein